MPSISNPTENVAGTLHIADGLVDSLSRHLTEAAVETADMWYDEFDRCTELLDELIEAWTLDRIVEVETDYLQCCRRAFAEHSLRFGDLCFALGEDMMKPLTGECAALAVPSAPDQTRARGENEGRRVARNRQKEWSGVRKSRRSPPPPASVPWPSQDLDRRDMSP